MSLSKRTIHYRRLICRLYMEQKETGINIQDEIDYNLQLLSLCVPKKWKSKTQREYETMNNKNMSTQSSM